MVNPNPSFSTNQIRQINPYPSTSTVLPFPGISNFGARKEPQRTKILESPDQQTANQIVGYSQPTQSSANKLSSPEHVMTHGSTTMVNSKKYYGVAQEQNPSRIRHIHSQDQNQLQARSFQEWGFLIGQIQLTIRISEPFTAEFFNTTYASILVQLSTQYHSQSNLPNSEYPASNQKTANARAYQKTRFVSISQPVVKSDEPTWWTYESESKSNDQLRINQSESLWERPIK